MSAKLFRGKEGQQLAREIGRRAKTFVPGAPVGERVAVAAGHTAAVSASARQNIDAIKVCLHTGSTTSP